MKAVVLRQKIKKKVFRSVLKYPDCMLYNIRRKTVSIYVKLRVNWSYLSYTENYIPAITSLQKIYGKNLETRKLNFYVITEISVISAPDSDNPSIHPGLLRNSQNFIHAIRDSWIDSRTRVKQKSTFGNAVGMCLPECFVCHETVCKKNLWLVYHLAILHNVARCI